MQAYFMEMGARLADRLARQNPMFEDAKTEDVRSIESNPFAVNRDRRPPVRQQRADDDRVRQYDQRWDSAFKVEIPEFHGGPRGEALLDWITTVDELLDFKQCQKNFVCPW